MLKIYNTLTQQKAFFQPVTAGNVNLYVCGMTVYDYCHIGHARVMVFFDVVYRYLKYLGYQVNYVRNITDIDDKIIHKAKNNQESYQQLTNRFIQAMHEDARALNILSPTHEPKATDCIATMIQFIDALIKKKVAYVSAYNGDVYFSVRHFATYGALAHQDIDQLRTGTRVSVMDMAAKSDSLDFVLWKLAKADEPSWDSPWGKGRPGWHIECSAMSKQYLGEQLDIHGGGFDLIFPHHQNEIAQSESLTHQKMANYWMHVGFVMIDKQKMSKSLNNFFTIREVLNTYSPEVVRYFMLTSHYRSQLAYSSDLLHQAQIALERLYLSLADVDITNGDTVIIDTAHACYQKFHAALQDDFNTPEALSVLFELVREINILRKTNLPEARKLGVMLKTLGGLLGILAQAPEDFLKGFIKDDENNIEKLIQMRNDARQAKNWRLADDIRDKLYQKGIILEDNLEKTRWRRLTIENASLE